jgi:hypothetical protein
MDNTQDAVAAFLYGFVGSATVGITRIDVGPVWGHDRSLDPGHAQASCGEGFLGVGKKAESQFRALWFHASVSGN